MSRTVPMRTALRELRGERGNSEDCAAVLAAAGVRGVPRDETSCPVALYLGRRTGAEGVRVGDSEVVWVRPGGTAYVCGTPGGVAAFVERFDDWEFRELDVWPDRPR